MKQMFLSSAIEFKEIETFEPGAWIKLVNPSRKSLWRSLINLTLIFLTCAPLWTWKKPHVLP